MLFALVLAAHALPSAADLLGSLERVEEREQELALVERVVFEAHNSWAEDGLAKAACTDPAALAWARRSRAFGPAYEARVRALQAEVDRASLMAASESLSPVAETLAGPALARARVALAAARSRLSEAADWQAVHLLPWVRRCDPPPGDAPALPTRIVGEWVAISWEGPRLCVDGEATDLPPGVVLLPQGARACVSTTCACVPRSTGPGLVLTAP